VSRPSVLVICAGSIGREMAGPGIRSYELARALRPHAEVTLAAVGSADSRPDVVPYDLHAPHALRPLIAAADAVVCQPTSPLVAAWLRHSDARVVYDLYDPEPLELLEVLRGRRPRLRHLVGQLTLDRYLGALRDGDQFVCASEKQRDLWLGAMLGEGRLGIAAYDRDPSGRELIDVVPFGLRAEPPAAGPGGVRARFGELGPEAEIVLWNGGIWSWLDAPTAVRAMAQLQQRRPQARLVFMGAATNVASRAATERARALAAQLGLLDRVVFFNDQWVPYEERAAWLLEAACAISTHVEHLETRFAFRTRLLDCFWAGLPVVCTRGDDLAALIERDQLGAVVPEGDVAAVAAALETVLQRGRDAYRAGLTRAAEAYRWDSVAAPLVRYVTGDVAPPPRGPRAHRRAGQAARDAAFRGGAATLNRLGLPWPRL
jgi:glycosyltransferase involved in cell wall biosynthesis